MTDSQKRTEPVEVELARLRSRVSELERLEVEHRRISSALSQSEQRYRFLMENAPLGVVVADAEGKITEVNQALLGILGSPSPEATRAINLLTFPPLVQAGVTADFRQCLFTGIPNVSEHPYISKWGKRSYLRYHLTPIKDDEGTVVGVQGLVEDFTPRKQIENALECALNDLKQKAEELEQVNEELNRYAAAVSHDVKAPLRAIRHYVEILQAEATKTLDLKHRSYLERIAQAVQQGEALAEDLLQLSTISERATALEQVDLEHFLRELVVTLNLPDTVDIGWGNEWPMLESDSVLLRQIFQNLILNAAKFNTSGKIAIELGCHAMADETIEIFVEDNGIGIDPRYHESIFTVFERLHSRSDYDGTGIGLALVKKAVHKLHGSVRVESSPGEGSTFVVTLPHTGQAPAHPPENQ